MKTIVSVFLYIVMCSVQIYSVSAQELKLNAKAAVIMDAESGKVLYGKSKDQKMPNASTTKILTCLYILEHCDIDQMAKVSKNASMQPKVRLGVREGESYKVKDLLLTDSKDSMLAAISSVIVPVFKPLGLGDWRICTSLISGLKIGRASCRERV